VTVSIIVPTFNEADGIVEFNRRLWDVRADFPRRVRSFTSMMEAATTPWRCFVPCASAIPTITIVNLSRNFARKSR